MRQCRVLRGTVAAVLAMVLVPTLVALVPPAPSSTANSVPEAAPTVIARYRGQIPGLMDQHRVPGLAVALVDAHGTLWVQGFGHLDGPDSAPVTEDTIFSVQSMSKLFTTTAVMQAVSTNWLDLDEPITTYLPDFTVHSAFEEHPER